jgi:histidinol phosphatase-like enzyme (inositol monophosphatase family)
VSAPPVGPDLVDLATDLARQAGALTLRWFGRHTVAADTKADGSPVTDADRAAEAFLRTEIERRFPDDAIVGEEHGSTAGRSGRTWIIDPIDGTRSFVRGVPLYSTLLALVDEHGPAVGVVVIPALDEWVAAGRGHGCWAGAHRCRVSSVDTVADACVTASSYDQPWLPGPVVDRVTSSGATTRTWGDGYGYLLLATGRVEVMIDGPLRPWDVAPMLVVIPEAGGTITTWSGHTALRDAPWVASNGLLHDTAMAWLTG